MDCADGSNPGRYRQVRHSATGFHVDQTDHSGDATLSLAEIGHDALIWVHAGTLVLRSRDEADAASRGEMRLLRAASSPVSLQTVDTRLTIVHLLSALPRASSSPGWLAPRSQDAAALVKRTVTYATDVVNHADETMAETLSDSLARLLRDAVLAGFACGNGAAAPDSTDPLPATLRAALTYIEAEPSRRISLADLAREAYATPRTVQYLFRRYLDTTPTAYVRGLRLASARQELLMAHRSETTVSATASRWGFGHTGRFAVLYRETYGESPHQTLAR
ncbi:helix-turn-helix transcriptional regulator [Mycolicibacterium sp. BiH015]|uniref:helix-turn-helix transcriptional regulator n=1 Tax=Mycolicibacterium sp. BiH015 TaxID=3018808 RepID=UPI0022E6029F|nr:helix-turn-helix transcriptional regulator [Mycolicibacterium sp. BiH015]MDA2893575.1 helix-turn-helix transcriptional regulator [Mycolicibacterium sp. BiH015]